MNEKTKTHLTKEKTCLFILILTLLHIIAIVGVAVLAGGITISDTMGIDFDIPDILCFAPLLLPLILDFVLRLKTDIKPYATVISPVICTVIFSLVFVIRLLNAKEAYSLYYNDDYFLFQLSLITLSVRCVYAIIDVGILKKYKLIAVSLVMALITVGFTYCTIHYQDNIVKLLVSVKTGTPDQTGSWGAINQEITRNDNWQQIVTDSPFKLGEIKKFKEDDGYEYNKCNKGSYPYIDGSTVCVPMAIEFARQHLGFLDTSANQFVQFSTTHYAYENLINSENTAENYVHYGLDAFIAMGSVDLVIATEPSNEELSQAKQAGVTLIKKPVCYDAFVFITHKDNPVNSLTVKEIRDIYSGKITNWKEVGGKDEKIRAFQREKNSGSQTAMENLVMGGSDMIDPINIKIIVGMGELVDTVAEYENEPASLGYTYRYYIDTLYKNDNIKTIAIDGIAPTDDNIRSEAYPFTTNYYGVIKKGDEENVGGRFLDWILSDEGQKCVAQAGYITMK